MNLLLALNGEQIHEIPHPQIKGVGMIRSEYICRSREEYITVPSCREYIATYLKRICDMFYPNEVWYRTTEFVVPEVNVLRGCDYSLDEKHYLMGLRGTRRGLKYPEAFQMELDSIARVSQECHNLNVLFPYIKDPKELEQCLKLLDKSKFKGKYGIMAEIPSTIVLIEDFIKLGINNITIGTNDLTSLTLGTYRGSEYHDHTHPAIVELMKKCVHAGVNNNIPVSVAGYLTKDLRLICEDIGVTNLIIHYPELNKILDVPLEHLPYVNLVNDIKKLTKARIKEKEENEWKKKLKI